MAVLLDALSARDDALDEVERVVEENSAFLHSIDVDPKMRPFLQEPGFTRVREALRAKWVD